MICNLSSFCFSVARSERHTWLVNPVAIFSIRPCAASMWLENLRMQRKIFWLLFITLGLVLDFALPIVWGLLLTFPLIILCWWIAFRSGWFE
jgi:hypothetical protein